MNLEIFERTNNGGHVRFDKPVLTVGLKVLYFNLKSIQEFKLAQDQLAILSIDRDSGIWHVCFLPELSTRKGYRLSHIRKTGCGRIMSSAKRHIDKGLEMGYYSFGKPEFDGELDWYELTKIGEYVL